MYASTREQARQFLFDVWRKYRAGAPLSELETLATQVIVLHSEYHGLLDDPDRHLHRDYSPESATLNPFLHLSLHLAIEEQLSIDRPPGIRDEYQRLCVLLGAEHEAKHAILECLGETLWQAQRSGGPPDEATYLECLRRRTAR